MVRIALSLDLRYWLIAICILFIMPIVLRRMYNYTNFKMYTIVLLITYIFLVFSSTVFSRPILGYYNYQLIPFASFVAWYKGHTYAPLADIYNFIMFLPIGFALNVIMKHRKYSMIGILCFGLSLIIEILQLVLQRGLFEMDDIILNVLGAVTGCCIAKRLISS